MRKLRIYFLLALLALAIPYGILIKRSYANLDQEAFFFYRKTAEAVISSISQQLQQQLEAEEQRSYTEYRYIHVSERSLPTSEGLNLSPLASFPIQSNLPGVLGYFQIDPDGTFHTPLLPAEPLDPGLTIPLEQERRNLTRRLRAIVETGDFPALSRRDSTLGRAGIAEAGARLEPEAKLRASLASSADVRLQDQYLGKGREESASLSAQKGESESPVQQRRLEPTSERQALVFDDELRSTYRQPSRSAAETAAAPGPGLPGEDPRPQDPSENPEEERETFPGAEVDPFRVQLAGPEWIILERKVWWNDRRYIQGLVAQVEGLTRELIEPALHSSALPQGAGYLLFHEGELLLSSTRDGRNDKPLLLENGGLPAPFSAFNLAITVPELPVGPGENVINLIALLAAVMIVGGVWGAYRLTATQWQLSRKQNDFVSAISHELKSPLTSIRMYGEMLMEGWVEDEGKKQSYYRQIHDESERLSRLIQNVLRLAQLERGRWDVKLSAEDPAHLVPELTRALKKPLGRAGFELDIEIQGDPAPIRVDRDALAQIFINLTDNAVKFAAESEDRRILIRILVLDDGTEIRVRDFGPGIPRGEQKRIFQQFYRVGSEMTRSTQGTGLGLALVKMLMEAMGGKVTVANRNPGAEFRLFFPGPTTASSG